MTRSQRRAHAIIWYLLPPLALALVLAGLLVRRPAITPDHAATAPGAAR